MFRKTVDYIVYVLYKIFQFIFLKMPYCFTNRLLQSITYIAYKFDKKHKKIALANLNLVYEKTISQKRKEEIIYNSYKSLAYNMYEFVENQAISKEKFLSKIKEIDEHYILQALEDKRKIIFVTAHYGGWEIALPYVPIRFGVPVAVVNRKMNNFFIHEEYIKGRAKNEINVIDKKVAGKEMIRSLKKNEPVAVVIDQHIGIGSEIEFLGQKCFATDSTARLALKFDAIIIPAFGICNGFRDYTIKIMKPIDVREIEFKSDNKIDELTQLQNDIITKQIFEYPDIWFWQHKRFKQFHSEIYN